MRRRSPVRVYFLIAGPTAEVVTAVVNAGLVVLWMVNRVTAGAGFSVQERPIVADAGRHATARAVRFAGAAVAGQGVRIEATFDQAELLTLFSARTR